MIDFTLSLNKIIKNSRSCYLLEKDKKIIEFYLMF